MSVLLRSLVAIPLLFLLVIVTWVTGQVIPPIAEEVLAVEAVSVVGFDVGAETLLTVGLAYVPGLFGLVIVGWWIFGALQTDYRGTRGGGYR